MENSYNNVLMPITDASFKIRGAAEVKSIEVIKYSMDCATITFEGGGDITLMPDINVGFTTVSFPSWLTLRSSSAGGSGNFSNEPSPHTVAFWLQSQNVDDTKREILFSYPVNNVEFFYASTVLVKLEAFDIAGRLIISVNGPANSDGTYSKWDSISISQDENIISKVVITGLQNNTAIDNLTLCRKKVKEDCDDIKESDCNNYAKFKTNIVIPTGFTVTNISPNLISIIWKDDELQCISDECYLEADIPNPCNKSQFIPGCKVRINKIKYVGCIKFIATLLGVKGDKTSGAISSDLSYATVNQVIYFSCDGQNNSLEGSRGFVKSATITAIDTNEDPLGNIIVTVYGVFNFIDRY